MRIGSIVAGLLPFLLLACVSKDARLAAFDDDEDGYYTELASLHGAEPPWDCDDAHAEAHPGGSEVCDELDNDCNGEVDDAPERVEVFADLDGDGFGDPSTSALLCSPGDGQLTDATDCDDANASSNPDALEVCDGADNDCDGTLDDDVADMPTWWLDFDEDGAGDDAMTVTGCDAPVGYVAPGDVDCDDADSSSFPGAAEICNDGRDNDCSETPAGCEWPPVAIAADVLLTGDAGDTGFGSAVAVGDLVGDAVVDVAIATTGATGDVRVWTGTTTFGVGAAGISVTGGNLSYPASIASGDLDDDGRDDLIVGWLRTDAATVPSVTTHASPLAGSAPHATIVGTGAYERVFVAAGDLVSDTSADVMVQLDTEVYAYAGPLSGTSSMAAPTATMIGGGLNVGVLDVEISSGDEAWYGGGASPVVWQHPLGVAASAQITGGTGYVGSSMASADLDGDGHQELLIIDPNGCSTKGCLYVVDGDDVALGPNDVADSAVTMSGTLSDSPLALVSPLGDVDGDNVPDLALSTRGAPDGDSVAWVVSGRRLWTSDLALGDSGTTRIDLTGGAANHAPYRIESGDVNDDGLRDVVIGMGDTGAHGTVAVYFGIAP